MSVLRLPGWLVATVVGVAAAGAGGFAVADAGNPVDWAFGTVVLSALGVVGIRVAQEWRDARREAARARALTALLPDEVAREAVRAERRRLLAEISSGLRSLLVDVRDTAAAGSTAAEPGPAAATIHESSRAATAELRRQLGLLRPVAEPGSVAEQAGRPARAPSRVDIGLAAFASLLAVVETLLWPAMEGVRVSPASVVLGALAAAAVVGARTWPVRSALGCAWTFLLGLWLGVPLYPGAWFLVSVCVLLWEAAARVPSRRWVVVAVGTLAGSVLVQVALTEPQNVPFDAVVMGVAVVGGLLARAARRRAARARERATGADAEITLASRDAVDAERAVFARELHDTVSHAIGLIAVQSAAALVSAPHDPGAARAALDLVHRTAVAALDELDVADVDAPAPRTRADLDALVARIRAAGTGVDLEVADGVGGVLPDPVYRVVQESLTNVVRHAPQARATVRVAVEGAGLVVEVSDDGPGVAAGSDRGFGLVGLDERVRHAGGSLATSAGPRGAGFTVRATLPSPAEVPA